MITTQHKTEVTVSVSETSKAKISNVSKIFRMLISGLYADKNQSITREIWSNALDAQISAGCATRPFEVTFPSAFDPTFRVRDFGIGMSHHQVMNEYPDLGMSTKETSDEVVGKFGIGSKSPFAYTDNFTVTVILAGEKRFYSAMIGEDGVPAIHLMGSEETEEEGGVEVAFPVEKEDVSSFVAAAKRVSHGFDVKPIVTNDAHFKGWPTFDIMYEGAGWKILRGQIEGLQNRAYARMGCVLYPINVNALGDLTTTERSILSHTVVIEFPIGELEPTASREELSYGRNEPTIGSIKNRVAIIAAQMEIEAQKSYLSLPTYWDACVKYAADISNTGQPEFIRNMIQRTASWNGRKLTGCLELTLPAPKYVQNPSTVGGSFEPVVAHAAHVLSRKLGLKSLRYNGGYKLSVPAKSETIVVVEDLTEGKLEPRSAQRLLNYVKGNFKTGNLQVIWLRVYNTKNEAGALTQFLSELDGAQVLMMSDIPEIPRAVRVSNSNGCRAPRQPVSARVLNTGGFREMRELTDEEFKAGGFYFKLERSTPVDVPAGFGAPQHLLRRLQDVMGTRLNVYGAPKSMWKKFAGEQWINFYDYAKKWVEDQKFNLAVLQERNHTLSSMKRDSLFKLLIMDLGGIGSNSPMLDYIMEAAQLDQEKVQDAAKVERLLIALGIYQHANEITPSDPIRAEWAALSAKVSADYPLLPILAYHMDVDSDITLDKMTDYVILCDTTAVTTESLAIAA
jgi:hypothetical protein